MGDFEDDDDDAWSYSFPASTDSLPLAAAGPNFGQNKPKLASSSDILQKVIGMNGNSAAKIAAHAAGSAEDLMSTDGGADAKKTGTSPPTPNLGLQTSFMAKSQPANPHTTREDASSVISSSSNQNGLAKLETLDDDPQVRFRNSGESDRNGEELVASPKIIAYRKSKRTISEGNAQNMLEAITKDKYDPKLYVDEKFKDSRYRYAIIKRNTEFHQLFRSIDLTDRLLDDFSCALSREILLQGRLYISETHLCFNSSLLGWVTSLVIPQEDVVRFEKRSTAGLFPNAIMVETKDAKHTFASFISRDSTYDLMKTVWEGTTGRTMVEESPSQIALEVQEELEQASVDNEKITDFIMTIDEDNQPPEETPLLAGVKAIDFRRGSGYKTPGPVVHRPTECTESPHEKEKELCNEVVDAPMSVVFEILFGHSNMDFQQQFLESHSGSNVSEHGEFAPAADGSLERAFSYTRSLDYRIGPQSTSCQVHERIDHLDYDNYIAVTTTVQTPDVPSGNSFSVKTKYRMTWSRDNKTNLQIGFYVDWTGPSWIKSIIEKSTQSGQEENIVDLLEALRDEIDAVTEEITTVVEPSPEPKSPPPPKEPVQKALPPAPVVVQQAGTTRLELLGYVVVLLLVLVLAGQLLLYRQLARLLQAK